MPTKDDYPYLAFWKIRGFSKFPTIPPEEISRPHKIRAREKAREQLFKKNPILQFLPIELVRTIDEDLGVDLNEKVDQIVLVRFQENLDERIYALGLRIVQAQIDHVYGKPREEILQELGQELFPAKQGGGLPLTQAHIKALKEVYRELREVIRRVGKENDLPLKKPPTPERGANYINLVDRSPWLKDILNPDEVLVLHNRPTQIVPWK